LFGLAALMISSCVRPFHLLNISRSPSSLVLSTSAVFGWYHPKLPTHHHNLQEARQLPPAEWSSDALSGIVETRLKLAGGVRAGWRIEKCGMNRTMRGNLAGGRQPFPKSSISFQREPPSFSVHHRSHHSFQGPRWRPARSCCFAILIAAWQRQYIVACIKLCSILPASKHRADNTAPTH
jgi:hypothetical protein